MPWNPLLPMQIQPMAPPPSPVRNMAEAFQMQQIQTAQRRTQREEKRELQADEDEAWFRQQIQSNTTPDGKIGWKAIERNALKDGKITFATKAGDEYEKTLASARKQMSESLDLSGKFWSRVSTAARAVDTILNDPNLDEATREDSAQRLFQSNVKSLIDDFGQQVDGPDGQPVIEVPDVLKNLPQKVDRAWIKGAINLGMTNAQAIEYLNAGNNAANDAITRRQKGLEATEQERTALANGILGASSPEALAAILDYAKNKQGITDKALYDSLGVGSYYNGVPAVPPTVDELDAIKERAMPFRMSRKDIEASDNRGELNDLAAQRLASQIEAAQARLELARARGEGDAALRREVSIIERERARELATVRAAAVGGGQAPSSGAIGIAAAAGMPNGLNQESVDAQIAAINAGYDRAIRALGVEPAPMPGDPTADVPASVDPSAMSPISGTRQPAAPGAPVPSNPQQATPPASGASQRSAVRALIEQARRAKGIAKAVDEADIDEFLRLNPTFTVGTAR